MQITTAYLNYIDQTTTTSTKTTTTAKKTDTKEQSTSSSSESAVYTPSETNSTTSVTYERPNKLSAEQIQALKQSQEESKMTWLKQMVNDTVKNQSGTASQNSLLSKTGDDLLTAIFGSVEAAIPSIATDPDEAAAAIAPGGVYSVEAVTERLMTMAKALAGDDPTMIDKMEKAVQAGFKSAGMDLSTGKGLPSICYETYQSTMKAFESWREEVGVQA